MTQPNTTLSLGSFVFQGLEIPTSISGLGVTQAVVVHRLIGGDRVVDAMGVDYQPITWGGLFFGTGAIDRLNALKALVDGSPQTLFFHQFNYLVLVKNVDVEERQSFEIYYRITCEVISDNSNPTSSTPSVTATDAINADLSDANTLAQTINDPSLTSSMVSVTAQLGSLTLSTAVPSQIAAVLQPLQAAQTRVGQLIVSTDAAIAAQPGFGGITVGIQASQMSANLAITGNSMQLQMSLQTMSGLLGRMSVNLNSLRGSPNTLAVAGGNLFQIAAKEYGDPTEWTTIANANDLTDPQVSGAVVLTIPLSKTGSGGILSQ